jgi:aryl-alcohol dehydrogenase-like predicted oxidoreductase
MRTRPFGSTSYLVTPLGLGLAALGRPGYITLGHARDLEGDYDVASMALHAHSVLDAAWDAGIRYFDVARSYGRAEEFLGQWLARRSREPEDLFVSSKWGYTYTADWQVDAPKHEVKEHSLAVLRRQWKETQQNLGPYLMLYQIHSATFESGVLDDAEVLNEIVKLKREGVLMGLTTSGPAQSAVIEAAAGTTVDGVAVFESVQATWNLLEQSAGGALAGAHLAGMGVIVKEAVANGRLTQRNDNPAFAAQRALLEAEADRLGATLDALAIAAAMAQPWADVVLSGAATPRQLSSNARTVDILWDDEAAQTLAPLAEGPEAYWETRANLSWN